MLEENWFQVLSKNSYLDKKTKMKKYSTKYTIFFGLTISVLVFLVMLITGLLIDLLEPVYIGRIFIYIIASIFSGVLITGGISIFNPVLAEAMTTLRRMLRIESLSNPLLLKLSIEAPGTYHHSLNVSSLAQKAAKSIKVDSLLVRTAAYYHDLGKLDNPTLYVENQSEIEIPTAEDEESIRKHANAIISHVEKGVKIAEEAKLPPEIIDLIKEHHGTTRALYFYGIAKERGLKIKKTDFRYAGPIPQSKEAAILMLADCVEAAARSTKELTSEKIKFIVENTIEERLNDNQFKNSHLTEIDLGKIKSSLVETLQTVYHQRIEYKHHE